MKLPKIDVSGLKSFIPEQEIHALLEQTSEDKFQIREIIAKSLSKQRLEPKEMALLLNVRTPELRDEIKAGAKELKKLIYGNRIVLFAPLYVGNLCINDCSLITRLESALSQVTRRALDKIALMYCDIFNRGYYIRR